jgi:branched-chain amino acid transport system ATP-binding protein
LDGIELRNRKSWDRAKAGLAHVPQGRRVFVAMSVRENLEVSARRGHDRGALDEVFQLFPRLEERQRQSAGSLSGGEQQMLAIACGLMMKPKIMVCDELSAGLAPVVVEELIAGLTRLRVSGMGILLVEQSPQFIVDAVDRVYLLEQGRVVDEGTFEALGGPGALAERYLGVR